MSVWVFVFMSKIFLVFLAEWVMYLVYGNISRQGDKAVKISFLNPFRTAVPFWGQTT